MAHIINETSIVQLATAKAPDISMLKRSGSGSSIMKAPPRGRGGKKATNGKLPPVSPACLEGAKKFTPPSLKCVLCYPGSLTKLPRKCLLAAPMNRGKPDMIEAVKLPLLPIDQAPTVSPGKRFGQCLVTPGPDGDTWATAFKEDDQEWYSRDGGDRLTPRGFVLLSDEPAF
jgi:hypothetical protein